jgi:hypothetical protein
MMNKKKKYFPFHCLALHFCFPQITLRGKKILISHFYGNRKKFHFVPSLSISNHHSAASFSVCDDGTKSLCSLKNDTKVFCELRDFSSQSHMKEA